MQKEAFYKTADVYRKIKEKRYMTRTHDNDAPKL